MRHNPSCQLMVRWMGNARISAATLFFLVLGGCGGSHSTMASTEGREAVPSSSRDVLAGKGPLKPIKWGVVSTGPSGLRIGAFVPYCEYTRPKPRVERVVKRRKPGRAILTMLVRFPPKKTGPNAGGCLGVQVSVSRWVKLGQDPQKLKLFDGYFSPPREVKLND